MFEVAEVFVGFVVVATVVGAFATSDGVVYWLSGEGVDVAGEFVFCSALGAGVAGGYSGVGL